MHAGTGMARTGRPKNQHLLNLPNTWERAPTQTGNIHYAACLPAVQGKWWLRLCRGIIQQCTTDNTAPNTRLQQTAHSTNVTGAQRAKGVCARLMSAGLSAGSAQVLHTALAAPGTGAHDAQQAAAQGTCAVPSVARGPKRAVLNTGNEGGDARVKADDLVPWVEAGECVPCEVAPVDQAVGPCHASTCVSQRFSPQQQSLVC